MNEEVGLWSAEYRVPGFLCRASALKLPSGGFLLFSPGAAQAEGFAKELGVAELLLLPNSFHHMGVPKWQEAFPGALVAAHPGAHKRLGKQGVRGLVGLGAVRKALPDGVTILEPAATRIGEVWLRLSTGSEVIWCIGDSFFNMPRLSNRFRTRMVQRTLRAAPGLRHSNLMKWGGLKSRRDFKRWVLNQIDADQPSKLVVLHGEVVERDAAERLRRLVEQRL